MVGINVERNTFEFISTDNESIKGVLSASISGDVFSVPQTVEAKIEITVGTDSMTKEERLLYTLLVLSPLCQTQNKLLLQTPFSMFRLVLLSHKGTVAMTQIATVFFNFSYRKTFDIKSKARSVGSNANLPTSLFVYGVSRQPQPPEKVNPLFD